MDVSGRGKGDKQDTPGKNTSREASPAPHPLPNRGDEAVAETQIDMVSRYAHPRAAKASENTRFDLRQFVARHPIPVALSCLALIGGTIFAAVVVKRRRRDAWDARLTRLRQAFVDAATGAG